MKNQNIWMLKPEAHDYPAAHDYLTLTFREKQALLLVTRLRTATPVNRRAKDILRASGLIPLPSTNSHVAGDLKKIRARKLLSPVLLVRGDARTAAPLIIADGFHRVCAAWYWDEDAAVRCYLVDRGKD